METILILGLIVIILSSLYNTNNALHDKYDKGTIYANTIGCLILLIFGYWASVTKPHTTKPQPHAQLEQQISHQDTIINNYYTTYVNGKSIHDTLIRHVYDTIRPECLPAFNLCDSIRLDERKKADSLIQAQSKVDSLNHILIGSLQSDNVLLRDTITDLRKPKRLARLWQKTKDIATGVVGGAALVETIKYVK